MNDWGAVASIGVLSLLIEAITEYLLPTFPDPWKWTKTYIAAAFAVLVCLAYGVDLPAALGLPAVAYVGPILTGLILGRGANFLSVLYSRLSVVGVPAQPVASVLPDVPTPPSSGYVPSTMSYEGTSTRQDAHEAISPHEVVDGVPRVAPKEES